MVKILIAGDLCPRNRCQDIIEQSLFSDKFDCVKDTITKADYSLVNLECPIITNGTPIKKQGSNLKSSPAIVKFINYLGFKGVTMANNHIRDYGGDGVIETMRTLKHNHIDIVGVGKNINEAKTILYKTINQKTVAFINVCEYEFSIANNNEAGANHINPIDNFYDIKTAKENADYVIVIIHGGHEHYNLPSPRMQDTYRFFVDAGADAVINHHQHCYSGYEFYKDKPIVYGLGNFYFDHTEERDNKWNEGYMLLLDLADTIGISLIPYVQCNDKPLIELIKGDKYKVFEKQISQLNEIIQDRIELESRFDKFCKTKRRLYMSVLEPYPSIYLKFLFRKSVLPSLLRGKCYRFVKNFVMCESHLDVIKNLLK
ncbi:MAG: CapA family protein [Alistipes sp.]|nr:CapA family protein [Alistipes sp.]